MHCCLGVGRELCTMSPFARHGCMARENVICSVFAAFYSYCNTTGYLLYAMSPAGHVDDALQHTSKAQFVCDAQLCQAQIMPEVIAQARHRAWMLLSATRSVHACRVHSLQLWQPSQTCCCFMPTTII